MRAAVVGHLEWVEFLLVERLPTAGDITHAREWWEEPGGGGPGAAVQLAKLAGEALFFSALGDDQLGDRAQRDLERRGLRVEAVVRDEPTRRAITHIEATGERTITVLGDRLEPRGVDALPWQELERVDALYFTAGDVGALRLARRARILVATARVLPLLAEAHVELDALVGSAVDPAERYGSDDLDPPPRLAVWTNGAEGGTFAPRGGPIRHYRPAPLPGPVVDRYGAGDSFAAGLAYALGAGAPPERAISFASRCGAAVVTGRGPYEGQLKQPSDREGRRESGS